MVFDEYFIKHVLPDARVIGKVPHNSIFSVDSRTIKSGEFFIALPGMQVDGHDYIEHALKKGACGVMIEEQKQSIIDNIKSLLLDKVIIIVFDTHKALIALATQWRLQFTYPVIAITGSVGKTSTKELLATILRVHNKKYLVSQGNQNTRIGVSLNILKMRLEHEVAIFEVGVNKRGEMAELAHIIKPTTALITTIGHSHMEGLGSLHDIALEKRDIFKYFSEESIGIINGDLPILSQVSYAHPMVKFGSKTTNQIQARKIRVAGSHISFVLKIYKEKFSIVLKQPHTGSVNNTLAATAAAYLLQIPTSVIVQVIQNPVCIPGRFEQCVLHKGKGGIIINDCYNANPESMKAALLALQQIETKAQKIAILGDMLELGVNSPFWHRQLGRFLRKVPSLKHVILVGSLVHWTKRAAPVGLKIDLVSTWQDAIHKLEEKLDQESVVLIKGSRAMGLGNLVTLFTQIRQ
jgi:UDP-N-acetylmuramoyl-tripeptide--D-alanyl-D-alanine ligase